MELTVYEKEIAPKGKAYLVLSQGPAQGLRAQVDKLRRKGAKQIFLASKDPGTPLDEGPLDGLHLTYAHDMVGMKCPLDAARPRPTGRLKLEPLTPQGMAEFRRIYHDSFFNVPNSETYDEEVFQALMGPKYRCGLALLCGAVAGVYELGFKKEHPEIGSIGLDAPYLGRGLGRELLYEVMELLAELGHTACWLQASTANRASYPLYLSAGFQVESILTKWFEVNEAYG